jgi:Na+/melibiose symporter-like transporter
MPSTILRFERLAYLGLAGAIIGAMLDVKERAEMGAVQQGFGTAAIVIALGVLVFLAARKRQNWARWVFAVAVGLIAIGSAVNLWTVFRGPAPDALAIASLLIDNFALLLQGAAIYFVFSRDSNLWFGAR